MKKHFTFLLIISSILSQTINAQLDMAFISSFKASSENSITTLTWTVANNQGVRTFDIERSVNGNPFKTISVLIATGKSNTENYKFPDTISGEKIMYRLRMVSKNQHEFYSNIIFIKSTLTPEDEVKIIGNPVKNNVSFNYHSAKAQQSVIKIYSLLGRILFNETINSVKGNNQLTIPLGLDFSSGIYVLEVSHGAQRQTEKFIKQ